MNDSTPDTVEQAARGWFRANGLSNALAASLTTLLREQREAAKAEGERFMVWRIRESLTDPSGGMDSGIAAIVDQMKDASRREGFQAGAEAMRETVATLAEKSILYSHRALPLPLPEMKKE